MKHYGSHSNFSLVGLLISFLEYKNIPVGVATINHTHIIINAHQLLACHLPNFSVMGPLISFWQAKQLPVGVVTIKPHPLTHSCLVINDYQLLWKHAKF